MRVVSFCDLTGNMVRPWAEAGAECWCVDVQHSIRRDRTEVVGKGAIHFVWGDVRSWVPPKGVRFGMLFNQSPCTNVAGSGARDFAKKRGFLVRDALELFEAGRAAAEWHGCRWMAENPVGILSSIPHIGKPDYYFDPCDFTGWEPADNYTKKTCIWAGNGFVFPAKRRDETLGPPDDRIHKTPPQRRPRRHSQRGPHGLRSSGLCRELVGFGRQERRMTPALRAALDRTTEDLARVLSEGSGSLSIAAIAQERARIREQIATQRGKA